jgi:hypothetical protein
MQPVNLNLIQDKCLALEFKNFYCGDCVTKNEDINKQNAKHAYMEQHSPNFTLAQASRHINAI